MFPLPTNYFSNSSESMCQLGDGVFKTNPARAAAAKSLKVDLDFTPKRAIAGWGLHNTYPGYRDEHTVMVERSISSLASLLKLTPNLESLHIAIAGKDRMNPPAPHTLDWESLAALGSLKHISFRSGSGYFYWSDRNLAQ